MYVIVGLGNPGNKFKNSRHNVGFMLIDSLISKLKIEAKEKKFNGQTFSSKMDDKNLFLVKPMTYMNLSGKSLIQIKNFFSLDESHFMVAYDDIDLPLGHIRIRKGGSSGGHNGVKSSIEAIGSSFIRIRIGIGASKGKLENYVLENFSGTEKEVIEKSISRAEEAIFSILKGNKIEGVMNEYNGMV